MQFYIKILRYAFHNLKLLNSTAAQNYFTGCAFSASLKFWRNKNIHFFFQIAKEFKELSSSLKDI